MLRFLLAALIGFAIPQLANAQTASIDEAKYAERAAEIVLVLKQEKPQEEIFTEGFIAAVPPARMQAMMAQLTAQFGPLEGVDSVGKANAARAAKIALKFEKAIAKGQFQLEPDAPYLVAGFQITDFDAIASDGETAVSKIAALPGEANILFAPLNGKQPIMAHNADLPLGIGSTFKLYVLSALVQSIAAGEHAWNEVVPLSEKSLPSGVMQDWPSGSPVTLHTLAVQMISISDNTATDQLMRVLGREAIEAELRASGHSDPAATLPYVTTRELFILKGSEDTVLTGYAKASESERRDMLSALAGDEPSIGRVEEVFSQGPRQIDVGWYSSANDIRKIFARLADDETARTILAVNPGMPGGKFKGWDYVGFKGGSEPGVLNLSWLLRDAHGSDFVLSLGWNNPDANVSEAELLLIASQALAEFSQ